MLAEDHGLTVGHIQPLLGAMPGKTFALLDFTLDGNSRQLSSRRPPNLTEVERRLRMVPDVAIGPSSSLPSRASSHIGEKVSPRSVVQQQKEHNRTISMLLMQRSVIPPGATPASHNREEEDAGVVMQTHIGQDGCVRRYVAVKPSPRDVITELAFQRSSRSRRFS
jgi:hypothetical protein